MARRTFFERLSTWALPLLLAITLAVRVGVLVAMQDNLRQDPDAYRNIADNLVWFRVFGMGVSRDKPPQPSAYRPPLYPLLLAKFASDDGGVVLWRVAALHVVLALATVWLTWVVAGQMAESGFRVQGSGVSEGESGGEGEGEKSLLLFFCFAAGLMVACDPLLLNQSTLVMTETLAAFLTVLCLFALHRFTADRRPWNAGLAGGAIALAILCRPTYLPWLGLVGLTMLVVRHTNPKRERGTEATTNPHAPSLTHRVTMRGLNVASLGLIAAVVVSPWAIRNYRVFGKPIVSTTHGGYTFLLANNPWFYDYLSDGKSGTAWKVIEENAPDFATWWKWEKEREFEAYARKPAETDSFGRLGVFELVTEYRATELDEDRLAYERALGSVRDRPGLFAYSCLYRLRQLWSPLPHKLTADESPSKTVLRYSVAAWYVAVYLLAAVGMWKLRGKLLAPPWLWGGLLCLVFTGIHTFYWTNLRMRAPLMPFVALVAAYGLAHIVWQRHWLGQARSASDSSPQ